MEDYKDSGCDLSVFVGLFGKTWLHYHYGTRKTTLVHSLVQASELVTPDSIIQHYQLHTLIFRVLTALSPY